MKIMKVLSPVVALATLLGAQIATAADALAAKEFAEGESSTTVVANPRLEKMPDETTILLNSAHSGDKNVLAFSGMVYDHHRHKILTFGGGHATRLFPNSVHEFDLNTEKWAQLTEDVPPSAYGRENAVMTKDGDALGGVRWKGEIWAASRHTYDGLAVMPKADLMVCGHSVGPIGAAKEMPQEGKHYNEHYGDASGLWIFDPVKREWSVSPGNRLAASYGATATNPEEPDWFYIWGQQRRAEFGSFRVNTKTFERVELARPPHNLGNGPSFSADYYPERKSILFFPRKNRKFPVDREPSNIQALIHEYSIENDSWKTLRPTGDVPETHARMVVYDSFQKVFAMISHDTNQFHYYDPSGNRWYKRSKKLDIEVDFHHFVYVPLENVYVSVGSRWQTYAYKFSNTKGEFLGTAN